MPDGDSYDLDDPEWKIEVTDEEVFDVAKAHVQNVANELLGSDADKLVISMTESGGLNIHGPDDLVDRLNEEIARREAAGD